MRCTKDQQRWELTLTQAADLLGRPKLTVYRWVKEAHLTVRYATVHGSRQLLVRRSQVTRLQQTVEQRRLVAKQRECTANSPRKAPSKLAQGLMDWGFPVVKDSPAQASRVYRAEFEELLRAWKRTKRTTKPPRNPEF